MVRAELTVSNGVVDGVDVNGHALDPRVCAGATLAVRAYMRVIELVPTIVVDEATDGRGSFRIHIREYPWGREPWLRGAGAMLVESLRDLQAMSIGDLELVINGARVRGG